jgi:hypothetical protein
MNFSASCPDLVRRAGLLCLLSLFLPACSLFAKDEPEEEVLEQRTKAFIDIGWSWLHAENVRFLRGSWEGDRYLGVFEYEVVSDAQMDLLPEAEKERFAVFLPMCLGRNMNTGCHVLETVPFVRSGEYGWMPEFSLRLGREQLAFIAKGREKAAGE